MSKFAKDNNNYKFIITIIDIFSKKAWSFKLKKKTGDAIVNVMKPFFFKNKCKRIEFDQGTEFYNRKFLELLKRNKIKHYSVYSDRKCAIVERFNRTLKTRMYRSFTARGSHRWVDILPDLVSAYNSSKHSAIGRAPDSVKKSNEKDVRKTLYPKIERKRQHTKPYFKIGDTVRIATKKNTFQKGYEQTFSYEVFEVKKIRNTYPLTYQISDYKGEDIKGSFYKSELVLVDKSDDIWPINKVLKSRKVRGNTEYLVTFLGYPDTLTQWIPQNQLFNAN